MDSLKQTSFQASSDPALGASQISAGGDSFLIQFDRTPVIPLTARNVTITLASATIPYVTPNVTLGVNSLLRFRIGAVTYDVNLPTGMYSLSQLNNTVQNELENQSVPRNTFVFSAEDPSLKVIITVPLNGQVDFLATSPNTLLGAVSGTSYPAVAPAIRTNVRLTNTAKFDTLTSFFIHCDLLEQGLIVGPAGDTLASVLVDVQPGRILQYAPSNPLKFLAPNLRGRTISRTRMRITDQNNNPINMLGQIWSAFVVISWHD